jgi:hypothetical protein
VVNTWLDAFITFAGIGWAWSIHVEMPFVSLLAFTDFRQYMLWYVFVSPLASDVIDHHVLRCILCIPRHRMCLVKTFEIRLVVSLALDEIGQLMERWFLCPRWHERGLVYSCWDTSLSWDGFSQHEVRYLLCSSWHMKGCINTFWDAFCALARMEWVRSSNVDMHFLY